MHGANDLPGLTVAFFRKGAQDAELSERMSFAATVVQITYTDVEGENACTVWLDRDPIEAEVGASAEAEIELAMSAETGISLFAGRVALPIAILNGEVTYRGPVRKFLRVVPIMQSFDFGLFRGQGTDLTCGAQAS
ncbi:hypothetical protein NBH00_04245 [Paraconexibacter antarcticus]|uniref:SCP2 domain-containing protein n=1 Tax=Paraconexibacter antarcticus TaxID=2949664 RepID=A0ABY5DVV4_9ACTN|nr:hypothetical protein [Paraconexibacter antarcticus]UTI65428.1 hypothetical protein NBH00_04245 [Paraconexibacter antarcticus]